MEFAIGTLIAIVTLTITYLAYRVAKNQSLKRLHYTSFMAPLVLPRWYDNEESSIKVRLDGVEFILPILCAVRIENTGRVPIPPSDFSGPITIRLKGVAVFRCGELTWNREDIFHPRRPEPLTINNERSEISIDPILLNPRDSITMIYIADAAPEEWELEVNGRIAGVEEIIRLPKLDERSLTFGISKGMPSVTAVRDFVAGPPTQGALAAEILVLPILICPTSFFTNQLLVLVDGCEVTDARLVSFTIYNQGRLAVEHDAKAAIVLNVPESRVIKLKSVALFGSNDESRPVSQVDTVCDVRQDGHSISICPPTLNSNCGITASLIISGDCRDLVVESNQINLPNIEILHMETDDLIERNLAQAEPRLLLINQTLYRFWHSLKRRISRLKSLLKAFLTELRGLSLQGSALGRDGTTCVVMVWAGIPAVPWNRFADARCRCNRCNHAAHHR